jgi:hypothetical protein
MPTNPLKISIAALLALGTAGPTFAQPVDPDDQAAYQQRLQQYQDQQDQYQRQRQDYEDRSAAAQARRDTYQVQREGYQDQRDRYDNDRDAYERERDAYDARYGAGSWERRYGYSYRRRDDYYRPYAASPCERRSSSNTAAGGVIGALAGAAIGSNLAGRGDRTAGAVLGAVAGGVAGAAIGSSTARCDTRGYYFTYDQTYPYRDSSYARDRRYDYYSRRGCRLAQAPAYVNGSTDYRYVRVCPDGDGRFRITG